jgi:hypothetical protein
MFMSTCASGAVESGGDATTLKGVQRFGREAQIDAKPNDARPGRRVT